MPFDAKREQFVATFHDKLDEDTVSAVIGSCEDIIGVYPGTTEYQEAAYGNSLRGNANTGCVSGEIASNVSWVLKRAGVKEPFVYEANPRNWD